MRYAKSHFLLLALAGLLWSCQSIASQPSNPIPVETAALVRVTAVPSQPTAANTPILPPTQPPPFTPTPIPTVTANPTSLLTATPTHTPTATPIGPCEQRLPGDGLFTLVTLTYGLSRDYAPDDLVPLADYLPVGVTLGYPTEVRQMIVEPLVQMLNAMRDEGLQPRIISGYRSYSAQAIAWNKWVTEEPERAAIISAPPGFSEHQLGTTLDFGSPELAEIVGREEIQFHTYFYKTSEGIWLLNNAHRYGFSLSYPREAFELTGFYYEPWHYRYVGVELATQLHESGSFLTAYLLATQPLPCLP